MTKEEILQNKHAVVKFVLDGCAACKQFSPTFEEVKAKYSEIPVYEVLVNDEQELAREFGVNNFPTTILVKNQEVKLGSVGAISADELEIFFTADPEAIVNKHKLDLQGLYNQQVELDQIIEEQKKLIFKLMQDIPNV